MKINIDSECFKIADTRIDSVRHGKMSLESFVYLITEDDPFILLDNTIYALSEAEYYATRNIPVTASDETVFKYIMELEDISFMLPDDIKYVEDVRKAMPTCPSCRYKRYQSEIARIAARYKMHIDPASTIEYSAKYPETTESVVSKVSSRLNIPHQIEDRSSCIDCVEKHVSQAYILACEYRSGYTKHLSYACAHIAEAIDESKAFPDLQQTLICCLGITKQNKDPFIPVQAILNTLHLYRNQTAQSDLHHEIPASMSLDITDKEKESLKNFNNRTKEKLLRYLEEAQQSVENCKKSVTVLETSVFQGALACAADLVAFIDQDLAAVLRNRRLMFKIRPDLAAESGYDFTELIKWLRNNCSNSADDLK